MELPYTPLYLRQPCAQGLSVLKAGRDANDAYPWGPRVISAGEGEELVNGRKVMVVRRAIRREGSVDECMALD